MVAFVLCTLMTSVAEVTPSREGVAVELEVAAVGGGGRAQQAGLRRAWLAGRRPGRVGRGENDVLGGFQPVSAPVAGITAGHHCGDEERADRLATPVRLPGFGRSGGGFQSVAREVRMFNRREKSQ